MKKKTVCIISNHRRSIRSGHAHIHGRGRQVDHNKYNKLHSLLRSKFNCNLVFLNRNDDDDDDNDDNHHNDSDEISFQTIQKYDCLIFMTTVTGKGGGGEEFELSQEEVDAMKRFLQLGDRSIACCSSASNLHSTDHDHDHDYDHSNEDNGDHMDIMEDASYPTSTSTSPTLRRGRTIRITINTFLNEYGMYFENDGVVRTAYSKYFHPRHALISDGILHPTLFPSQEEDKEEQQQQGAAWNEKTGRRRRRGGGRGGGKNIMDSNDDVDGNGTELLEMNDQDNDGDDRTLNFVYPNGCTMDVQSPSTVILSSGGLSFPCKRPICGVWEESAAAAAAAAASSSATARDGAASSNSKRGSRLLAIGSTDMFADEWLDEVSNKHLIQTFLHFLLLEPPGGSGSTRRNDATSLFFGRAESLQDNDNMHGRCIEEARVVPDIEALSERLKWCLEEHPPLPQDLTTLYRREMISFNTTDMIPKVMDAYHQLNVKQEPLTLILPEFERASPPLQPAVFQPKVMDMLSPPPLDQYDLDEEFAESSVRLAQLTNKCCGGGDDSTLLLEDNNNDNVGIDEMDLEYYVQEAGSIAGLVHHQDDDDLDAKKILRALFDKIVDFKCSVGDHDNETPVNNIEIKRM